MRRKGDTSMRDKEGEQDGWRHITSARKARILLIVIYNIWLYSEMSSDLVSSNVYTLASDFGIQ